MEDLESGNDGGGAEIVNPVRIRSGDGVVGLGMRILGRLILIWAGLTGPVRAHDPGLSTAQVEVGATAIRVLVTFSATDLAVLRPAVPATTEWIEGLVGLHSGTRSLMADRAESKPTEDGELRFELEYRRPEAGGTCELRALKMAELPPGHRQFVTVASPGGPVIAERLLSTGEPTLAFQIPALATASAPPARTAAAMFGPFFKLGVEHIWAGYDHLLFLFGLLVVCARFRSCVAIVSCFTLGHSITLAVATLDWVNLPARYTEPLIAASIVYVGMENLWRRGAEPRGRWAVTFAFGLIHGFGFASVLRDLGVGQGGSGLLLPLFSFNLGVELGQIAVAAVALPLIWRLRRNEKFLQCGVPALSALVAAAGLYWLLERTIFG